jgi:hypothetical protein
MKIKQKIKNVSKEEEKIAEYIKLTFNETIDLTKIVVKNLSPLFKDKLQ